MPFCNIALPTKARIAVITIRPPHTMSREAQTGRVVAQFSRDVVLKMIEDTGYSAGEVIRTKA